MGRKTSLLLLSVTSSISYCKASYTSFLPNCACTLQSFWSALFSYCLLFSYLQLLGSVITFLWVHHWLFKSAL